MSSPLAAEIISHCSLPKGCFSSTKRVCISPVLNLLVPPRTVLPDITLILRKSQPEAKPKAWLVCTMDHTMYVVQKKMGHGTCIGGAQNIWCKIGSRRWAGWQDRSEAGGSSRFHGSLHFRNCVLATFKPASSHWLFATVWGEDDTAVKCKISAKWLKYLTTRVDLIHRNGVPGFHCSKIKGSSNGGFVGRASQLWYNYKAWLGVRTGGVTARTLRLAGSARPAAGAKARRRAHGPMHRGARRGPDLISELCERGKIFKTGHLIYPRPKIKLEQYNSQHSKQK